MALTQNTVDIREEVLSTLSVSSTSASKQILENGIHDLWCATDVFIRIGGSVAAVTTTTGYLLRANNTVPFAISKGDYIVAITASASDTLYHIKTGEL